MKKEEIKKNRGMAADALLKSLVEEQTNAVKLKLELKTGKAANLHAYSKKRKEIAILKTILTEKTFSEKSGKGRK